jgi:RNA polymerase sigma-70 factor (ECF subfamily)
VGFAGSTPRAARPVRGTREPAIAGGEQERMGSESDAVIISASLHEPGRFGTLFDRHATVVFRYLVRRVGVDEADSLLGEVFRIAFEKRATFDCAQANARPWLYGIATNLLARHRRSEARRIRATARLLAQRPPFDDPADRVATDVDAHRIWPYVAEAVARLPAPERDALLLYSWEELGYEEIAVALGVPVGTVRSRLHRARLRLRELPAPIGRQT